MNQMGANGNTAIIQACWTNNLEMVKLFLTHGADPNLSSNKYNKMTTMHIAAINQNVQMMKLLIQHGFNIKKSMNQIIMSEKYSYKSVFLLVCKNGSVECLDYLLSVCNMNVKNKNEWWIDVFAKDSEGQNGLYLCVRRQKLSMCEYLLKKVYDNDELRQNMMNQTDKLNKHISHFAAENTSEYCVAIFKLLIKYKCNVDYENSSYRASIYHAASHCSSMFSFMVNQGLFDAQHQCKQIIKRIVDHGLSSEIKEKNITTLCNYIKNNFTSARYVDLILEQIIKQGFEDNLIYFIISLNIFLSEENIKNWKYFYQNKYIITKKSINKLKNILDIDKKWIELLNDMLMAHNDVKKWHERFEKYNINSNDKRKANDFFSEQFYSCYKNHRMKHDDMKLRYGAHCCKCDMIGINPVYKCDVCNEYICVDCDYSFKLNQMLKMQLFKQFDQEIAKHNKNDNVMQQVKFSHICQNLSITCMMYD